MSAKVTLIHWNVLGPRFDYGKTWAKRYPAVAGLLAKESWKAGQDATVISLNESAGVADKLAKDLHMAVEAFLGSAVLYPKTWRCRVLFRFAWLGSTHGAIGVELSTPTGERFNVISSHLPPFVTRAAMRRRNMATLTKATAHWQDVTLLATDANWTKTLEKAVGAAWLTARKALKVSHYGYRTNGRLFRAGNPMDYVFLRRPSRAAASYDVIDGRRGSDHNALQVTVTL